MKIENQVTNLELSKKLKELGVKQESLYYWGEDHEGTRIFSNKTYKDFTAATYKGKEKMFYKALDGGNDIYEDYIVGSAFTVAELGEMLPYHYVVFGKLQGKDGYSCSISPSRNASSNEVKHVFGKTEADARASMLIYLIEQKLL